MNSMGILVNWNSILQPNFKSKYKLFQANYSDPGWISDSNLIQANQTYFEPIRKMFWILFDANWLKINPNKSEVGLT